jgi:hypothetical protein
MNHYLLRMRRIMPKNISKVMSYLEKLVVEIGPRPIGSHANQAAADFMRDTFRAAGLQVEEQPSKRAVFPIRPSQTYSPQPVM